MWGYTDSACLPLATGRQLPSGLGNSRRGRERERWRTRITGHGSPSRHPMLPPIGLNFIKMSVSPLAQCCSFGRSFAHWPELFDRSAGVVKFRKFSKRRSRPAACWSVQWAHSPPVPCSCSVFSRVPESRVQIEDRRHGREESSFPKDRRRDGRKGGPRGQPRRVLGFQVELRETDERRRPLTDHRKAHLVCDDASDEMMCDPVS